MNFGIVLLLVGGFLLGGVWSAVRTDPDINGGRRTTPQIAFALVLLAAAVLATVSGILRLV